MDITLSEIEDTMEWLFSISGYKGPGTIRFLYSPGWLQAQKALKARFTQRSGLLL